MGWLGPIGGVAEHLADLGSREHAVPDYWSTPADQPARPGTVACSFLSLCPTGHLSCARWLAVSAEVVGQFGRVASGGFGRIDDALRSVVPGVE